LKQKDAEYFLSEKALHEIIPGVFLTGTYEYTKMIPLDSRTPSNYSIEFAVGLTEEKLGDYPGECSQLNIGFKDFQNKTQKDDFIKFFNEAAKKIDKNLSEGKSVVIYCQ
jgi:hypothetical protein